MPRTAGARNIVASLTLLAACGYGFGAGRGLPGGVARIYVEPYQDHTVEAHLAAALTGELRRAVARGGFGTLVGDRSEADAVLRGQVLSLEAVSALASTAAGLISPYSTDLVLIVQATLVGNDGVTLWSGRVSERGAFLEVPPESAPQDHFQLTESNRRRVMSNLLARTATVVYDRMTQDF